MSVSPISSTVSATTASANSDRMNDLSMSDFIKMMVAELENQDPTNPMSNTEMLSQINQIRQITSNDNLSSSIESLTLGQTLTTASGLIGKTITGTNSLGKDVTGTVDKVMIENGKPKLYVGSNIVDLTAISSVVNTPAATQTES
jgi:flagellar basal-body rod modification protein FlgD